MDTWGEDPKILNLIMFRKPDLKKPKVITKLEWLVLHVVYFWGDLYGF